MKKLPTLSITPYRIYPDKDFKDRYRLHADLNNMSFESVGIWSLKELSKRTGMTILQLKSLIK